MNLSMKKDLVDIFVYLGILVFSLFSLGEYRGAVNTVRDYDKKIVNEKLILINDGAYRCNKLLSDTGAKPRGER